MSALPPYSQESEKGILGCILMDSQETMDMVVGLLKGGPDAFFDRRHRLIYEAALALWEQSMAIDTISVVSKLRSTNNLDDVGGVAYISEVESSVPSIANLTTYINTVQDHHTRREVIRISSKAIERARDGGETVDGVVTSIEEFASQVMNSKDPKKERTMKEITQQVIETFHERSKGVQHGIQTGIVRLDRTTGGFHPGEFIIIAGRPSQGKTVLTIQIATYAAMSGQKLVGVFSLEMAAEKLVERIISSLAHVNTRDVQHWSNDDYKRMTSAAIQVSKMSMRIEDRYGMTIGDIKSRARKWKRDGGLDMIVLDYLQLVKPRGRLNEVRHAIEEISRELKGLAGELNVPVVAACQLNREIEKDQDRKPRMSDIREAGGIEQDADVIGALYRANPEQDLSHPDPDVNLWVLKNRNGAAQFDVKFRFVKREVRFDELTTVETGDS